MNNQPTLAAWAPVAAAFVAGAVAIIGYRSTQNAKRLDQKAELYAKALAAVTAYKQLAYRIRRRPAGDSATRKELGQVASDVHEQLTYYRHLLRLDSGKVAEAYDELVRAVYRRGKQHRDAAWRQAPTYSDLGMTQVGTYLYEDHDALDYCIYVMREQLKRPRLPAEAQDQKL
jgi:hypothetical protein